MGTIAYTVPQAGTDLNSIADAEIATALTTIKTWANGNVDATNIAALLAQAAGVNQAGQVVKGAVNIATSESRTNVAYGTLPTPDQVTGIVLPTNGLIAVWYQATWQESVSNAAKAAIFLGANQIVAQSGSGASTGIAEAVTSGATGNLALATGAYGLASSSNNNYTGDVTTGQVVGSRSGANVISAGPCYLFAAAGTYTVSVQFKASSGSVTASNRKLWVLALSFS